MRESENENKNENENENECECPDESESRMNDGREKRGMKPNRPPRPVSGSYNGELDSSDIWSNVFF